MRDTTPSQISFICCKYIGFGLLAAHWINTGDAIGFFLMLFMACMVLLRWRRPELRLTVAIDVIAAAIFFPLGMGIALFSAMYYRKYWAAVGLAVFFADMYTGVLVALCGLAGFFLGLWEKERAQGLKQRDLSAGRFYELEQLQSDLYAATVQIERMTLISERARIAREIHDNAGHEIVAAYMSLQTARHGLDGADPDALELYDAALERLDTGANKIREAVHNLAPVTALGVEALRELCENISTTKVELTVYGDTNHVPVHVWGVLEACLSEAITNAIRHANPEKVRVFLDTTPNIARLNVENDSKVSKRLVIGNGLRNLRYRAASVGGSLTINPGEKFRVICVIPIKKEGYK